MPRLREWILGLGGIFTGAWIAQCLLRRLCLRADTTVLDAAGEIDRSVDAATSLVDGVGEPSHESPAQERIVAVEHGGGLEEYQQASGGGVDSRAGERNSDSAAASASLFDAAISSGGFSMPMAKSSTARKPSSASVATTNIPSVTKTEEQASTVAGGSHEVVAGRASASRSKQKPNAKEDGLFAKGFLNKPAKKAAEQRGPVPSGSATTVDKLQPSGGSRSATDAGGTALRTVEESVAQEQATGTQLFHGGNFRDAHKAFERMRDAARNAGLGREEGQAYRLIGNALDKLDAPESEVEEAYKCALRFAHKHDDMELSFNVLTGMGSHAIRTGDLDLGEHFYLQALTLAGRVLADNEVAIAEGNLGMVLGMVESRRTEAFSHFRKAIALHERPGANAHSVVTLRANLATALSADGKYIEAQAEYERALTLARTLGNHRVEANILTNLANLFDSELANPDKARECRQALAALQPGAARVEKDGLQEQELCAVCLEPLEGQNKEQRQLVTVLACRHAYHTPCWTSCQQQEGRCPLCRKAQNFAAA